MSSKYTTLRYIVVTSSLILSLSCTKTEFIGDDIQQTIKIETLKPNTVGYTTAKCEGNISGTGNENIADKGICWSTESVPQFKDNHQSAGKGSENFSCLITKLTDSTTYYVCAYAIVNKDTLYGDIDTFNTLNYSLPVIYDIDSNAYHQVEIGEQTWLVENLRCTHYRNGDPIPIGSSLTVWKDKQSPLLYNYDNDSSLINTYGYLYNWYAATNVNICPEGWTIPSKADWKELINYLGGTEQAGAKLKSLGLDHWETPNTKASNKSYFNALPGGYMIGKYHNIQTWAYFWAKDNSSNTTIGYALTLNNFSSQAKLVNKQKQIGIAIRCIKE